mgnify:CR=1 FL=1
MTVQECIQYVESHLEIRPATDNGAYTSGRTIKPAGCVNHSVGCAQPSVDVFFNTMNKSSAGWVLMLSLVTSIRAKDELFSLCNGMVARGDAVPAVRVRGIHESAVGDLRTRRPHLCWRHDGRIRRGEKPGLFRPDVEKWSWHGMSIWSRNSDIRFLGSAIMQSHIVPATALTMATWGSGGRSMARAWMLCGRKFRKFSMAKRRMMTWM